MTHAITERPLVPLGAAERPRCASQAASQRRSSRSHVRVVRQIGCPQSKQPLAGRLNGRRGEEEVLQKHLALRLSFKVQRVSLRSRMSRAFREAGSRTPPLQMTFLRCDARSPSCPHILLQPSVFLSPLLYITPRFRARSPSRGGQAFVQLEVSGNRFPTARPRRAS